MSGWRVSNNTQHLVLTRTQNHRIPHKRASRQERWQCDHWGKQWPEDMGILVEWLKLGPHITMWFILQCGFLRTFLDFGSKNSKAPGGLSEFGECASVFFRGLRHWSAFKQLRPSFAFWVWVFVRMVFSQGWLYSSILHVQVFFRSRVFCRIRVCWESIRKWLGVHPAFWHPNLKMYGPRFKSHSSDP